MSTKRQTTEIPPDPIDEVLAAHNGNVRTAILALLMEVEYFRSQAAYGSLTTSSGYTYGWMPSYQRVGEQ